MVLQEGRRGCSRSSETNHLLPPSLAGQALVCPGGHCAGQRLWALHWAVEEAGRGEGREEHHCVLLQPQLHWEERRQPQHTRLCGLPRGVLEAPPPPSTSSLPTPPPPPFLPPPHPASLAPPHPPSPPCLSLPPSLSLTLQVVTALALAGSLDFNPLTDELVGASGERFKLKPPYGDELPSRVRLDWVGGALLLSW